MRRDSNDPSDAGYEMRPLRMPAAWQDQPGVAGQDGIQVTTGLTQNYTTVAQPAEHATRQEAGSQVTQAAFPPPTRGAVGAAWQLFFGSIGVPVDWPPPPDDSPTDESPDDSSPDDSPPDSSTDDSPPDSCPDDSPPDSSPDDSPPDSSPDDSPPDSSTDDSPPDSSTDDSPPDSYPDDSPPDSSTDDSPPDSPPDSETDDSPPDSP